MKSQANGYACMEFIFQAYADAAVVLNLIKNED